MLREDVQIYYNGADELRFRKGVWNFEEAVLTFEGLKQDHKDTLVRCATSSQRVRTASSKFQTPLRKRSSSAPL